jgi:hypothetical protein
MHCHRHVVAAVFFSCCICIRADVTGSILGTVKDSTDSVIPKAAVVVTNVDTNLSKQASSDDTGQFRFLALPVGKYRLTVSAPGFQQFVTTDINLNVNDQFRVDPRLVLGNVQQQVEIAASAIHVETDSTQLGDVIDSAKILSLPLNGRSYVDLLGLQAGVAPATTGSIQQDRPVSGGLSAGNISVNGQRETANAFLVNGGDVSEGRNLGTAIIPNLDSISEFRLITNSFDAEYGRFSGSIMNAITKSGTNAIHGSVFEFLRNDKLDARNFFDPAKAELRRNQFGYAVGGPAIKNRLFWFTDYQGTREVQGASTGLVEVPSVAQRAGVFTPDAFVDASGAPALVQGDYWAQTLSKRLGYTVTSNEPYSTPNCVSTANCVFPGGMIPTKGFAPPTPGVLKFIPLPNSGDTFFTDASGKRRVTDDKIGQRVDFVNQMTGNWSFYYHYDDSTVNNPLPAASLPGFPSVTPSRGQQALMSNVKTLSPTAVNEFRLSFLRISTTTDSPTGGFAKLADLGFATGQGSLGIIPSGPPGFPQTVPPMYFNNFSIGVPTLTTTQPNNTWHVADGFSKIWGRHTMKFGGEFRYHQINERNVCAPNGDFTFDGSETGNDIADFLIGAPVSFNQCSQQFLDSRSHYGGLFTQDTFKMRPNVVLNLGLRWEVSQPWYDTQGKIETIVPGLQSTQFPTAPLGWVVPGDPGIPKTLAPTRWNNVAPRVGIAYSPGFTEGALGKLFGGPGKTSIRAAFGIYYTAIEDLNLFYEVGDAPFGLYWVSPQPTMFDEPYRTRADGVSQGQRFPFTFPVPGAPSNKTLDYSVYLPISYSPGYSINNRLPYAEHYNFSIQRALSSSTVLTLAYVGTQGHRLISQYDANPGDAALCLSLTGAGVAPGTPECGPHGEQATYTRPDGTQVVGTRPRLGPAFGVNNSFTANIANSNYNSLQVSFERKAADLTFLLAYTFAKAIDNSSSFGEWVNFSNYRLSRSLSAFDVRHNLVGSYNWAIPFDRLFSGAPKRLTQGWNILGISRFSTGFPVRIRQGEDQSLVGSSNTDVPDLIGAVVIQDPRNAGPNGRANQYFSPESFVSGPLGRFGNASRRFFHGPGIINSDIALRKATRITENMLFEVRAEFFNIFNHASFNNPNGNFSSSRFGTVSSARDPRIGQIGAKLIW